MKLGDLVAHRAATAPAATALIVTAENRSLDYAALADLIGQAATALANTGLAGGDVVGLRAANTIAYVVGLLGAARAGLVVAPLDPALPAAEQQDRMQRLGARAVLTDSPAAELAGAPEIAISVAGSSCTVCGEPADGRAPSTIGLTPDDAMVMFTSGTTGKPKMVPWTHDALDAAMSNVVSAYRLRPDDATVAVMPMFHGHGLVAGLLATLSSGGTLGLPQKARFSAHTFFDELTATGATWVTAVPTIYQVLLDVAPAGAPAAARLRFLRSCSAPLPPAVAERLEAAFDAPVLPAYGMTEATHQACAVVSTENTETRLHTVGAPVGTELRIATSGEVWLRGPAVARGYLNDPAATAATFADGWLRTGDLGSVNEAGVLTLRGRIKNIINRGGEKISPERVEDALLAQPDVVQAAVFPVPDQKYGEQVAAVVVLRAGATFDDRALQALCASRLATYEVPEKISPVDELPVTAKGSVDRNRLVALFS